MFDSKINIVNYSLPSLVGLLVPRNVKKDQKKFSVLSSNRFVHFHSEKVQYQWRLLPLLSPPQPQSLCMFYWWNDDIQGQWWLMFFVLFFVLQELLMLEEQEVSIQLLLFFLFLLFLFIVAFLPFWDLYSMKSTCSTMSMRVGPCLV